MKILTRPGKKLSRAMLMAVLYGVSSLPTNAAVLNIDATFSPDSAAPHKNEFVNKTPSQGFCLQVPWACEAEGLFSLIVPISFTANAPIRANHADPRQGGMAKVPSNWRPVRVVHSSGESQTVEVRIAGIGHESLLPVSVVDLTGVSGGPGWDRLWRGGSWMYAPPPCQGVGWSTVGNFGFNSFWKVPVGAGVCAKQSLFEIPRSFRYQYLVIGYQLRTPNPLAMKSGSYNGSITFDVGPNQDFDMGDVMRPDDSALTLNFNLEVQHTLKVDIPPGGEKFELVPAGGWQGWLQAGRKPVRLFRDQTFQISASSRFKMYIECKRWTTLDCVIEDAAGRRAVELQVSVSLPNGLTDLAGQPVKHRRLQTGANNAQIFKPGFYVDRAPGVLHFEVPKDEVDWMLSASVASPYSGSVTVIWDSEI
ncbi:hypothetical protein KKQ10_22410 [Pseudomonas sp. MG-9]|uniref:hypothetical protein n=1 Tax=Pseudomonas sp. MG-9 TaxID=2839032 RepID=UPI001C001C38|nr:hypothetical protein [Pseudomonas sp. MG-9]MBT9267637.1 hypothetical protein [Pseudomonas sp. MG-9]